MGRGSVPGGQSSRYTAGVYRADYPPGTPVRRLSREAPDLDSSSTLVEEKMMVVDMWTCFAGGLKGVKPGWGRPYTRDIGACRKDESGMW